MLKTSGLVLDVHDDIGGEVLRSFFPTQESIPEVIKEAHALTPKERELLPDDDYALVLIDGDQKFRKFACIDEGNTQLNVLYFAANAHKLPEEAQKVAASNLVTACGWYGIKVPEEIEKIALGLDTVAKGLSLASIPSTVKGVHTQMKQNMSGIRAHEAMGQTVVSPNEMKMAEVAGTSLQPSQPPSSLTVKKSLTPVLKSAAAAVAPDDNEKIMHKEQPESLPQAKAMKPHIDVSNKEPTVVLHDKKASRYALENRYPLDNYEQVKMASSYFDEYGRRMSPENRHTYCVNLVKRASELNIQVSDIIQRYGSEDYAPDEEIKAAFDARRNILVDDVEKLVLMELEEKRAMIDPDLFCMTLEEFDKVAGLSYHYDSYIPDPYYSTYGVKVAEDYSFVNGNDMITEMDLIRFGKTSHKSIVTSFGDDFANEFRKDPVGIFKSLPLSQKKMIMHMANDNAPGAEIVP
jgi:hypothetical protein